MPPAPDDAVLAELRKATSDAAGPAGEGDAVCGVQARYVAVPATTEEVANVLRVAADHDLAVVVRGRGTKLRWGSAPERVDVVIGTTRMADVVAHVAGDLVVTVQAGVELPALRAALSPAGQRLAVDPVHADGVTTTGTVGGLVATGVSGPLRLSHGAVRDLLIGVTVVRADGVVARAGGKVVKNVAGYDLGKLMCGSWGTLAVVTEATFRLHPQPPAARWVVAPVSGAAGAYEAARRVLHSQLVPAALELDRPADGAGSVGVLVEGTVEGVRRRAEAVRALLGPAATEAPEPPPWWGRVPWRPEGVAVRLTTPISGLPALLDAVDAAAAAARLDGRVAVRGSAGAGVLHAALPPGTGPHAAAAFVHGLRATAPRWGGEVVVLDAPAATRQLVDMWGPAGGLELMRRVKERFDPDRRLAPGRFVGGI